MRARFDLTLIAGLLGALLIPGSPGRPARAESESDRLPPALFNVGYRVVDFKYGNDGQDKVLTVAVWYPTAAPPKPYNYGGPTNGNIAVDAPPLSGRGPFPLLVFSHGYGGSGLGAVFLTEALAARGWIVAAPDHHDRDSAVRIRGGQVEDIDRMGFIRHAREIAASHPEDRAKYLYRLDEMRLVVNRLVTSEPFRAVVDPGRLAVGGHSLGGFTALGLCGTIGAYHDPRIRAVLLFSTGAGGYLFTEGELRAVRIPSMLFQGEREKNQLRGSETMSELTERIYRDVPSPKYFLEVKGASHFSFNNRFADTAGAWALSGTEEQFAVIRRYSIAFLEKYVAGRDDPVEALERGDSRLTRYLREPPALEGRIK